MSDINLAEVAATFIHGGMPADEVETALRELPIRIVPLDENQAYQASALSAAHGRQGVVARRQMMSSTGPLPWASSINM